VSQSSRVAFTSFVDIVKLCERHHLKNCRTLFVAYC
jgi:hypothetical protein